MPRKTINDNETALEEAAEMQRRSLESLERSRRNAEETHEVGATTLEELYAQRKKLENIDRENERLSNELERTDRLQNKLSRWALDFGGKRKAKKHVNLEKKNEEEMKKYTDSSTEQTSKPSTDEADEDTKVTIVSRKKNSRNRKKKAESPPRKRELLDGVAKDKKYQKELDELNEGDKNIDDGLDALGGQLDSLMSLSKTMGEETRAQETKVTNAVKQVEANNDAQNVSAKRLSRFFTGGRRQQRNEATKESMLGPLTGSKAALKASKAAMGL